VSQVSSIPQDVTAMSMRLKYVDSDSGRQGRPEDYSPKNDADIKAVGRRAQCHMGTFSGLPAPWVALTFLSRLQESRGSWSLRIFEAEGLRLEG